MKTLPLAALAIAGLIGGSWKFAHGSSTAPGLLNIASSLGGILPKSTLAVTLPLADALRENVVEADFIGNGRERMKITLKNLSDRPVRIEVAAGTIFKATRGTVVIARGRSFEVAARATLTDTAQTAALSSANVVAETGYELTAEREPRIAPLIAYLENHREVPPGAVQTATLAMMENLPLRTFAQFATPGRDLPGRFDTKAFRVDTPDILVALTTLRALRIADDNLALTIDPQLRIEAMIDPLAHALALKYFRIGDEWAYWKEQLLSGDPSTRHYALYGIARFYPDVALQMLPKWARETRTEPVYRISAVQALAETQRIEALSTLRQITRELGHQTEIGKVALLAADCLDTRLNHPVVPKIAFRTSEIATMKLDLPQPPILAVMN